MSIDIGVTVYSMTNEWLARQYNLVEMIDEIGKRNLGPGIELIGFQSLRGFPNKVDNQTINDLKNAIERNGLIFTSLAANADVGLRRDNFMDTDASVAYMTPQIELAGKLGVPVMRTQINLTPPVLEKLEPIAAKHKVHLGMEIHAPEGPHTEKVSIVRQAYERIDSEWLGFVPDFSSHMRAIPQGMLNKLRGAGLSEKGVQSLIDHWHGDGMPFQRYMQWAEACKANGEPELPINQAKLVFTMFGLEDPEGWREMFPMIRHIHGKFYDVDDDLTSPSIDYQRILNVFKQSSYKMTFSSEWEGHAYLDIDDQCAFEMVAKHQAMCRKMLNN